ncbi:TetR/AcrR family transcriptional regulator [Xanthobacteraceae bacterium A53D]
MPRPTTIKSVPRAGSDKSRADSVRRIIYERAVNLFQTKGFRATSMNEIALACGVSKPALYHYFRDKSHLLETLYADVTAEFFLTMEKLAHATEGASERLRKLVELQTVYNIENRSFLTIFWRERHEFDELSRRSLAAREREFEAWVMHIIEEGQASGEFRKQDPRIAMMAVLGLLSTVHRWAPHAGKTADEVARELGSIIVDGVAAPLQDQSRAKAPKRAGPRPRAKAEKITPPTGDMLEETRSETKTSGGKARPRHRRG